MASTSSECVGQARGDGKAENMPVTSEAGDPDQYEHRHVHSVYNSIAPHFSLTRYKPWPRVKAFVESLPPYALVADVGCGNGKNFCMGSVHVTSGGDQLPARRFIVGLDYSEPLLRQARLASRVATPWSPANRARQPAGAKAQKRVRGVEACFSGTGDQLGDAAMGSGSAGEPTGLMHQSRGTATVNTAAQSSPEVNEVVRADALRVPLRRDVFDAALSIAVIHHFCTPERRLAALQELLHLVRPDGGLVLVYVWALEQQSAARNTEPRERDALVPWQMHQRYDVEETVYKRYYHFFEQGELEALCEILNRNATRSCRVHGVLEVVRADTLAPAPSAEASCTCTAQCRIKEAYFDKENHCVVLERVVPGTPL